MKLPQKWAFNRPSFEYHQDFDDYIEAWVGHIFFGYDLVANMKPDLLVELGTYKGTSMYSFAQAAKDNRLNTSLYAIDCWEGDAHAGFYGEEIYAHVQKMVAEHYPQQHLKLIRSYFADALDQFEDNSIDILHIDGLHSYEAVKADYSSWKVKVKQDGIILFHDIAVQEFGVKGVWADVKAEHPDGTWLEFKHSHGLGVLFRSQTAKNLFTPDLKSEIYAHYEQLDESLSTHRIQSLRTALANVHNDKLALIKQVDELGKSANQYREYAELLQKQLKRRSVKAAINLAEKYGQLRKLVKK